MAVHRRKFDASAETDMTPMIDMTFQLVAFFMLALTIGEGERDSRVTLPTSALARPTEAPLEWPLVLQLDRAGMVLFGGEPVTIADLGPKLLLEQQLMERRDKPVAEATVVIRGDARAAAGDVRSLIEKCQEYGFEKFALRAQQEQVQDSRRE